MTNNIKTNNTDSGPKQAAPLKRQRELKAKIRNLAAQGNDVRLISAKLNLPVVTIRLWMRRMGMGAADPAPVFVKRVCAQPYRYDTPDQIVIEREDTRPPPMRDVTVFSISSLI